MCTSTWHINVKALNEISQKVYQQITMLSCSLKDGLTDLKINIYSDLYSPVRGVVRHLKIQRNCIIHLSIQN